MTIFLLPVEFSTVPGHFRWQQVMLEMADFAIYCLKRGKLIPTLITLETSLFSLVLVDSP